MLYGGLGATNFYGLSNLGISANVKVSLPPEVKAAVRELPNLSEGVKSIGSALDAANVTSQSVAVLYVFGTIAAVLLLRETFKSK